MPQFVVKDGVVVQPPADAAQGEDALACAAELPSIAAPSPVACQDQLDFLANWRAAEDGGESVPPLPTVTAPSPIEKDGVTAQPPELPLTAMAIHLLRPQCTGKLVG